MVKAQGNNKNTSVKATAVTASPNVNAKPVVNNLSVNGVNDLSKYYSELSKDYAEQAKSSAENVTDTLEDIKEAEATALSNISMLGGSVSDSINAGINQIGETTEHGLNDLQIASDEHREELTDIIEQGIEDIQEIINNAGGGGTSTSDNGIKGDYATRYGITSCQNGLVDIINPDDGIININRLSLSVPGMEDQDPLFWEMEYTVQYYGPNLITLFAIYKNGPLPWDIFETCNVFYSEKEPTISDNVNIAWFNPNVKQWQFKYQDTNEWVLVYATPIADLYHNGGEVHSLRHIGYRVLDKDIFSLLGSASDNDDDNNDNQFAIKAYYSTKYGIIDAPNGIIDDSNIKEFGIIKSGLSIKIPNVTQKLVVEENISFFTPIGIGTYTIFLAEDFTQYVIPTEDIVYSVNEPSNPNLNMLWFNPDTNIWQSWVADWNPKNVGPIADIINTKTGTDMFGDDIIETTISYAGYRILDDVLYAKEEDIPDISNLATKEELETKQGVLNATDPIRIGTTTIGEPNNINVLNGVITPTVVANAKRTITSYSSNETYLDFYGATNTTASFEDLFKEKSYLDIPINFGNYFTDDYTYSQYLEVVLSGMTNSYANNSFTFFVGQLLDGKFKVYATANIETATAKTGADIGCVSISNSIQEPTYVDGTSTRVRYKIATSAYDTGASYTSNTEARKAILSIGKTTDGKIQVQGTWHSGSYKYRFIDAELSSGSWQLSDLQNCNVIRVVFNNYSSNYATTAYLPTSEGTYVRYYDTSGTDNRLAWNIENSIVKTYGISLNIDNETLKIVDGKLSATGGGSSYTPPLLSYQWTDHILNDIRWLRADTFSWQDGGVYFGTYDTLEAEYNNENSVEETDGAITYKRTPSKYKIADVSQEEAILNKYNTDGIAWYYIIDTVNKRFKLPRTKFGFTGVRDGVGNDVEAGLPNMTGRLYTASGANMEDSPLQYGEGVFSATVERKANWVAGSSTGNWTGAALQDISFDASSSNATYKDGATVQPPATQMYLYFYVGSYTTDAVENTAGLNAELFNNKADIDGSNMVASVKNFDGQFVVADINLGSFTAVTSNPVYLDLTDILPKDGYNYLVTGYWRTGRDDTGGTDSQCKLYNNNTIILSIHTDGKNQRHTGVFTTVINNTRTNFGYYITANALGSSDMHITGYRRLGTNQ